MDYNIIWQERAAKALAPGLGPTTRYRAAILEGYGMGIPY